VRAVQHVLLKSEAVNGQFGSTTEKAVMDFQKARGLSADGQVGQQTWSALLSGGSSGGGGAVSGSAVTLANAILANKRISLFKGNVDDPWANIDQTSKGQPAVCSARGNCPGGQVRLTTSMLSGMQQIAQKMSYRVTWIVGGAHGANSYHFKGSAFDVDMINGQAVINVSFATSRAFRQACIDAGAIETIGPDNNHLFGGHKDHMHCAW
jgi:hypothetical protein